MYQSQVTLEEVLEQVEVTSFTKNCVWELELEESKKQEKMLSNHIREIQLKAEANKFYLEEVLEELARLKKLRLRVAWLEAKLNLKR